MTKEEKMRKLNLVIQLLHTADCIQQEVIEDSDVCYDNHNRIESLIDDIIEDIEDIESREE